MRGDFCTVILGLSLACGLAVAPSAATGVQAVAQEKAAAVSIIKSRAQKYTATLAQGRLFSAYLNASTISEGARLRTRIGNSFKALENHYGMRDFSVVDRSGELFVHVGKALPSSSKRNVKKDPVLSAGFAQQERAVAIVMDEGYVTYASPVMRRGEKEFVLCIEQELSAYDKVLAYGLAKNFYVVVVDKRGKVLSDSRPHASGSKPSTIEGLTLEEMRSHVGGNQTEGTGRIVTNGTLFNISYQTVGDWTVVAVEPLSAPQECLRTGEDKCR